MAPVRNVLFIMCDQLRFDYLSCMGHPYLETPNIDRLAAKGVIFPNAFCQSAVCGPSRMSFYTGRYVSSHGATWNAVPLPVGEPTLGEYLRAAGLRVALAGKTHALPDADGMARLGIDPAGEAGRLLANAGFEPYDRHEGHVAPPPDSHYNRYLREHGYGDGENPWEDYANAADSDGGHVSGWWMRHAHLPARVAAAHSETAYMTDRAMQFIEGQGAAPWLLHLSFIKPHWPYLAPAPYNDMYGPNQCQPLNRRDDERQQAHPVLRAYYAHDECRSFARDEVLNRIRPVYMGLVKEIDDNLGRLFDFLERSGRMDDTLIAFTSDHGDFLGDHWLGEKEIMFEEAVRIPMIVYDPDPAAGGTRGTLDRRLVESIDLVPTFLDAVGAPPRAHLIEGRSLLPATRQAARDDWRDAVVCELDYSFREARRRLGRGPRDCRAWMLRTARWKYIRWDGFPEQLFDLESDPGEYDDLGDDPGYETIRTEMRLRLLDWYQGLKHRPSMPDDAVEPRTNTHRKRGIHIGIWDPEAP